MKKWHPWLREQHDQGLRALSVGNGRPAAKGGKDSDSIGEGSGE